MSNGTYLESEEGLTLREKEMKAINERFDDAIDAVRDPGKHERQMEALKKDPLMSAGLRGLRNMRWQYQGGMN